MDGRRKHDKPARKAEIVARVRAGEVLGAVCAGAGMPSTAWVQACARADAEFRAELTAAVRQGAWRRLYGYDEAKAAAFLARVRAGERVNDVVGQPGMPSRATYEYWRRTQAPFAEAMAQIRARRNQALAQGGRDAYRHYDPALGDRIVGALHKGVRLKAVLASDPAMPCAQTLSRWRREAPAFDRAMRFVIDAMRRKLARARTRRTPALTRRIADRIRAGASLHRLAMRADMPGEGTLYRWMARDPAFAAAVRQAYQDREVLKLERLAARAQGTSPSPGGRAD